MTFLFNGSRAPHRRRVTMMMMLAVAVIVLGAAAVPLLQNGEERSAPESPLPAPDWQGVLEKAMAALRVEGGTLSFAEAPRGIKVDLGARTLAAVPRILPLGDSITAGTVDLETRDTGGYREWLWRLSARRGGIVEFVGPEKSTVTGAADPHHAGFPRRTLAWALEHAPAIVQGHAPDVILMMFGTNDSNYDRARANLVRAGQVVDALAAVAPDAVLLVADPPPMRPDAQPARRIQRLAEFVGGLPQVIGSRAAQGVQAGHVPMDHLGVEDISTPPRDNGLHPNPGGYCRMARRWSEALSAVGLPSGVTHASRRLEGGSVTHLVGSPHNDLLIGDGSPVTLTGGAGNDVLIPRGGGADLWGGDGADLFVLGPEDLNDAPARIHDLDIAGGDRLDLTPIMASLPDAVFSFTVQPGGTLLSVVPWTGAEARQLAWFPGQEVGPTAIDTSPTDCPEEGGTADIMDVKAARLH